MFCSGEQYSEYEIYQYRKEGTVDKEISGGVHDAVIFGMIDKEDNTVYYKNVSFSNEPLYEIVYSDAEQREYKAELVAEDARRIRHEYLLDVPEEDYDNFVYDYHRDFRDVLY